jgi:hypothetical protein
MKQYEITAHRVAKELDGRRLMVSVMMKDFGISYKTASKVYEIQGYKPLTKFECAELSAQATRKQKKVELPNLLTIAWV